MKKMIPDGNLGDAERNEEQQKMVNIYVNLNYYFLCKMIMIWGLKDVEIKLITLAAKKEGRRLNGV